jgi:hypothetical protein
MMTAESILDHRYAWPVNEFVALTLGVLWFGIIWLILEKSHSFLMALLYSGAVYAICWVLICDFVFRPLGLYISIGAPGLLIFVGKGLDRFLERRRPGWAD